MAATLTVRRDGMGIELRRKRFEIVVDGSGAGSIDWQETVELAVEPGAHTLQLTSGRYSSMLGRFEVSDGDNVNFRCHSAMVWPRWLVSLVVPQLAIALKRG
jgi:hypothetical protein